MRPQTQTRQLATADPDGIVDGGSVLAGGAFTLNGALVSAGVAQLGNQRRVLITSTLNLSAATFTVAGTNASGVAISEDLAGPNATTAATLNDFETVTSITCDAQAGDFATGILTFTGNANDTGTVTLGATTYVFQTVLVDAANNVLIGATASDSIDNLIAAITAGAGAGTLYGTGTVANADATAAAGAGDTMDATALTQGVAGNSVDSTQVLTNATWGATDLAGGVDGADIGTNGVGAGAPIKLDQYISPFSVSLGVLITGTVNATVQFTVDEIPAQLTDFAALNWFDHADLTGATADANGTFIAPVTAARLLTNSGDGTAVFRVIQAGGPGA